MTDDDDLRVRDKPMIRRLGRIGGWAIGGLMLLALIGGGILATTDLRPLVERYAAASTGRTLAIGVLRLGWNAGPTLRLENIRLANLPGTAETDMLRLGLLEAQLDWAPLLTGRLQFRTLHIEGLELLLERLADGTANWHFAGHAAAPTGPVSGARASPGGDPGAGPGAVGPTARKPSPTLLQATATGSQVRYRTTGGQMLRIDLNDLAISAASDSAPVRIVLQGAYNGTPGTMSVQTGSFALMRDGATPFPATVDAEMADAKLHFQGNFMQPLDADDAEGQLEIAAEQLSKLLTVVGMATNAPYPTRLAGRAQRHGDHWRLDDAAGEIAGNPTTGRLALDEGPRGKPDSVDATLDFPRLQLAPFLAGADTGPTKLALDPAGTRVKAHLSAATVTIGKQRLLNAEARFTLDGAAADLSSASFETYGGRITGTASLRGTGDSGRITGEASITGAELGLLAGSTEIAGRIGGRATIAMQGKTWPEALRASSGHAVLEMSGGQISRDLLERVSTDLRSLVTKGRGTVHVTCLLSLVDLQRGVAQIAPLRLRTNEAIITGGGTLDVSRRNIDLVIQTERTGFFALDLPLHISGPIANPAITPTTAGNLPRRPDNAVIAGLPPELRTMAQAHPCGE